MMTEPTQTELRTWARAQGIAVKDRGSLPLAVRQAYLEAHGASGVAEDDTEGTAAAETWVEAAPEQESPHVDALTEDAWVDGGGTHDSDATPDDALRHGGPAADLAAGLNRFLASVEAEVAAVSALSDHVDAHVAALNDLREEQAVRLIALDALRESVTDSSLSAFLTKVIRPQMASVTEVVPERLQ